MTNKTKIVATIGPASSGKSVLRKMIVAGMNAARLNLSHGAYQEHSHAINTIRSLSRSMNRPIGIIFDLQGPKMRTGKLIDGKPLLLKRNHKIRITTKNISGTIDLISTTYAKFADDIKKNDRILLDDGLIELKAISKKNDTVSCKIIHGGMLRENKGINLPGVDISAAALTAKDRRDINFGIKSGADFFAISFVRSEADVKAVKSVIKKQGCDIPVIAKIEKPEAVKNLHNILDASDGIMVARGDLGVEMKPERIPTIQKQIIHKAIQANRPVITATQMLETMINNPIPTRAEASDVANAIYDGTDAVMLSAETAAGRYPEKAVRMMTRIAAEAEKSNFMKYDRQYDKFMGDTVTCAVAQSSVRILNDVKAKAIVVFSVSGKTAALVARQRPSKPVYAFTPSTEVYHRMALSWGITPQYVPRVLKTERLIEASEKLLLQKGLIQNDDLIVLITGLALKSGSTNLIKIHRVGQDD